MNQHIKVALVLAAAAACSPAMAVAYRCVAADAKVRFQDRPCDQDAPQVAPPMKTQAAPTPTAPTGGAGTGAWQPTVQDRTSQPQRTEEELKARVLSTLKDPDSAKFQGIQHVWTGRALCGQVNARNSYGGYTGFKAFVADSNGVYWEGDGSTSADVGRREARNTYFPKAHFWGCLP